MSSYTKVYLEGMKIGIKRRLAYKADFAFSIFTMLIGEMFAPLFIFIIYTNSSGIPGWTAYELLLLQGIFLMIKGFSFASFGGMIWNTIKSVKDGALDVVLLKPLNPIFNLISHAFDAEDFGKFFGGVLLTVFAVYNIGSIEAWRWIPFIIWFVIGLGVFFCFALLASALAIKYISTWRIYEVIETIWLFGQYPVSIYSKVIAGFLTFIVPIAYANYYPALFLLGKPDLFLGIPIFVTSILIFLCYSYWMHVFKSYSSAGG